MNSGPEKPYGMHRHPKGNGDHNEDHGITPPVSHGSGLAVGRKPDKIPDIHVSGKEKASDGCPVETVGRREKAGVMPGNKERRDRENRVTGQHPKKDATGSPPEGCIAGPRSSGFPS